jgi:hypothetical protein
MINTHEDFMKDAKQTLLEIIRREKIDESVFKLAMTHGLKKVSDFAAIFALLAEKDPALLSISNCVAIINFEGESSHLLIAIQLTSEFISPRILGDFLKYPEQVWPLGKVLNILYKGGLISANTSTPEWYHPSTSAQVADYLLRAGQEYNYDLVMRKIKFIPNVTLVLDNLSQWGLVNRKNFLNLFAHVEQANYFNLAIHNLNGAHLLDQNNVTALLTLSDPTKASEVAAAILAKEHKRSEEANLDRERRVGYLSPYKVTIPEPQPVATSDYPKPPRIYIRRS